MGESKLVERTCHCGKKFMAKKADVARGWAKSCSKSCAATKREKKTGNFARFCNLVEKKGRREQYGDETPEFNDAHLFSNEEHDCNKD